MQKATILVAGTFRTVHEQFFADYSIKVRRFLELKGAKVIRRQLVERTLYGERSPGATLRAPVAQ